METVDTLVTQYLQTEDELGVLGKKIAGASKNLAIAFIDLSGSTELKHKVPTPRWLGYVVRFLEATTDLARRADGTVVKRIGDELMITFEAASNAESFVSQVVSDERLSHFEFKVGLDWGETYGLSFDAAVQTYDPYGQVVDRAARIAKLATRGTVLASEAFVSAASATEYSPLGKITLKGIPQAESLYLRKGSSVEAAKYLKRLLDAINKEKVPIRFRYRPREFTLRDFEISDRRYAGFPFLVRELLTLPLLPLDFHAFNELRATNLPVAREYLGHVVEWKIAFYSASDNHHEHFASALLYDGKNSLSVSLHPNMSDSLRVLKQGQAVVVRGVLVKITDHSVAVDYADIQPAA